MATKIRKATPDDIEAVIRWLKTEHHLKGVCPFYNNREQFRRPYGRRIVLEKDGSVIGLMIHTYDEIGYLVIHHRWRGMGYGRRLFKYKERLMKKIKYSDCLAVQTFPYTSVPFWESMGFEYDDNTGDAYKYY